MTRPTPAPPSRNHPCPCGSGKRYKHCCGSVEESAPSRPAQPSVGETLNLALKHQLDGKLSLAEKFYRDALALDANNVDALHMLGVICMERLRYAEALELLFRAAELSHWALPAINHNLGLVIARLMTRDANARQDQILANQLSRRRSPAPKNADKLPEVSIILYSRNQAEYIAAALASVYGQTYRKIELIVMNDGSTDGSSAIVERLLATCPFPHRLIAQDYRGVAQTLDAGAALAQGSFLTFLHADDTFAPKRIEQLVSAIAASGAQWGYSGVTLIDAQGSELDPHSPAARKVLHPAANVFARISGGFTFLEHKACASDGNIFIEKDLFLRSGGFSLQKHQSDRDFLLRAADLSEPLVVDAPLYLHRLHDKNSLSEPDRKSDGDHDKFLMEYYAALESSAAVENELSPAHAQNRILLHRLGLGAGHGKFLPAGRLRALGQHWLESPEATPATLSSATNSSTGKQALIVLGMHRSGTSAFSRMLNLCGAYLPDNKHAAKVGDNEKGFWEPEEVPQLNERLLKALGASWLNVEFNLAERMYLHDDFIADAVALLQSEYGNAPLILIKDPRMCVLVPWWDEALRIAGYEPVYVIPVRNPLEVAGSLHARNDLAIDTGLALWLQYFDKAEAATRNSRRVFSTFTDLMTDWKACVSVIAAALGVKLDTAGDTQETDSFLEERLRRQRSTDESLFNLPPTPINQAIKEKYRWALQQAATRP